MTSTTFTARVYTAAKKRLDQYAGIKRAIASLDRGKGIPHARVKEWVASWGSVSERPRPKRTSR